MSMGTVGLVMEQLGMVPVLASFEVIFAMDDCASASPTGPSDISTIEKDGYCWSHGFKVAKGHNSSTCKKQKN